MIVCAVLVLAALVAYEDARSCRIRNGYCAAIAALGLLFQAARIWAPELLSALAFRLGDHASSPEAALSLAVLLGGTALELLWRHVRRSSGLGLGDVKYVAAWATLLGQEIFLPFAAACLVGAAAALARRQERFALGPYLSAAFSLALVLLSFGIL
ncbi:MAG: prepilin peptidase [Atopobiaceae bacterium]